MRKRIIWLLTFLLAMAGDRTFAAAGLSNALLQKGQFYEQTADNTAPAAPFGYSEDGFITTAGAGVAASFTLSDHGTDPLSVSPSDPTSFSGASFYSTNTALNAAFTAGDSYHLTANGGTLAGQSGTLPIPSDLYPPLLYLTGTAYTAAQMLSGSAAFSFSFTGTGGTATATDLQFDIYDPSGASIYFVDLGTGVTNYTIPKSVIKSLTPGMVYTGALNNFNTNQETGTGILAGVSNAVGLVAIDDFPLEVVPEPAATTCLLVAAAGLGLAFRWSGRRDQGKLPSP